MSCSDFDTAAHVCAEIDFVTEVFLFSDKCTPKEMQKLNDEFKKELVRNRCLSKVDLRKYLREDKKGSEDDEDDKKKKKEKEAVEIEQVEDILSQNSKFN